MTLHLVVYGKAEPAGSKRAFANKKTGRIVVTDDNARSRPWKQQVARQAVAAREATGAAMMTGAVAVTFTFVRRRPTGHFGTGRNSGRVRASASAWPVSRPDVLKLARGVEDALTGIVWVDDAQIVEERICKVYGDPERCEIVISELACEAGTVRAVTPHVGVGVTRERA